MRAVDWLDRSPANSSILEALGGLRLNSCHAPPPQIQRHPGQARQPDETPLPDRAHAQDRPVLGTVEATDAQAAEKVAAIQFELDEFQRRRLLVREIG